MTAQYGMILYLVATVMTLAVGNWATLVQHRTVLQTPPLALEGEGRACGHEYVSTHRVYAGLGILSVAIAIAIQVVPTFTFRYQVKWDIFIYFGLGSSAP